VRLEPRDRVCDRCREELDVGALWPKRAEAQQQIRVIAEQDLISKMGEQQTRIVLELSDELDLPRDLGRKAGKESIQPTPRRRRASLHDS